MIRTHHAIGRLAERLTSEEAAMVTDRLAAVEAARHRRNVAVRVARLTSVRGDAWSDGSNGSDVWAIVRDGSVVTVMLRRKQQPTNPAAFNVDRVILAS